MAKNQRRITVYLVMATILGSLILYNVYLEIRMDEHHVLIKKTEGEIQQSYDNISQLKRQKAELLNEIRFLDSAYKSVDLTEAHNSIQPNDPAIQSLAASLGDPEAIYYFVRDNIAYSSRTDSHHLASETLQIKEGNCVEKAELLASLLRANGTSEKNVHVYLGTINEKKYYEGIPPENHAWIEFYYDGRWLVLDPSQYLGDFSFEQWDRETFYEYFKADSYFEYNDKRSTIIRKVDPYSP